METRTQFGRERHNGAGLIVLAVLLLATLAMHAQSTQSNPDSNGAQSTGSSSADGASSPDASRTTAGSSSDQNDQEMSAGAGTTSAPNASLTARQIFGILQEKPEVVIELKSQLADQLQQQGVTVDPGTVTDEMLYNAIATDRNVRSKITLYLRVRGYISDTDLRATELGAGSLTDQSMSGELPGALSPLPGSAAGTANLPSTLSLGGGSLPAQSQLPSMQRSPLAATTNGQRQEKQPNITDAPEVLREPTPYNLQSLRDLYTQIPNTQARLKRFGSEVFLKRETITATRLGGSTSVPSLDVPIGPDYVIGPGDSLSIDLWGGLSQTFTRVVDRDGHLTLPEAGEVQVAGLTLERAQSAIAHALQQQYRNAQVSVTVAALRSVRVYVVGDVEMPGAYDVSSLATPLSALYAAGGPTAAGSLRVLRHYRGKQLVGEVDLYDFFLHGVRANDDRLEAGDTLLVPTAGPQVAVSGAVRRPAIYELKDEQTLDAVLADAGGLTVAAALGHITVERIDAHQHRETVTVDGGDDASSKLAAFTVKDGDRVRVAPIVPYSERVIYLEGHVVRPGRAAYRDGMKLNDVLHSYQDLLPEPADRGEIVRLTPPDLHPETIEFNVPDVLIGNETLTLEPFDTIRIFSRYEVDAPRVTVSGEVLRPGSYPLSQGMTAAQLVRMAGGFRRDALLDDADLMSYRVQNGTRVLGERTDVRIGDAVKGVSGSDAVLKAGDVLTIHQITGWNDIGESVTIEGEVAHPGSYGFKDGEHLSDVLQRAGGFRETAYPEGAVLTRPEVRDLEEKSREQLIRQIETNSAAARLAPNLASGSQGGTVQLIEAQEQQVVARLRSAPAIGRLVIHITADIDSWAGTPADIEVRKGDVLKIPKRPGFVLVSGQVYNTTAITFAPNRSAGWYLSRAGGSTAAADRKEVFIIRANGSVVGRRSGGWGSSVLDTKLEPGDVVVVPQKIIGAGLFWRNLLLGAQAASSIAITAGIANLL
ncbi:MAG: SLBB domain-containing protein [Acidobacteriaceae bacterium]